MNTNLIYLKRFHVIPSGVALAYASQDIQRELARAQRHYVKTYPQTIPPGTVSAIPRLINGIFTAGTSPIVPWRFPVEMRAAPTGTSYSPTTGTATKATDGAGVDQAATISNIGSAGFEISIVAGNLTAISAHATANARLS